MTHEGRRHSVNHHSPDGLTGSGGVHLQQAGPWYFAGEGAIEHFRQRANGQRSIVRGGDLFTGRAAALDAVENWLMAAENQGVPLLVVAQPGGGKSSVVAHAALNIERRGEMCGLAFHARGASVGDFIEATAGACGTDLPRSWQTLVSDLSQKAQAGPFAVVVDALDEAASERDRSTLAQVLRELARVTWLRVVVATRPLAVGNVFRPGGYLHGLGVTAGRASRNLVDLDQDQFFASSDLVDYAETLLAQRNLAAPGPVGGAWEQYRHDRELCRRLAEAVAARAGRNFLVAGLASFQLSEDATVLDPGSSTFDASRIPGGVDEALGKYLDRLPSATRDKTRGLLTALAYGRGPGLDDDLWLAFSYALGYTGVTPDDLVGLRDSAAADYLLETDTQPLGVVTRLFHQAFSDELRAARNESRDERCLLMLIERETASEGWIGCTDYVRNHAASHAAAAGELSRLMGNASFLVGLAPASLWSHLRQLDSTGRHDPGAIYGVAYPFLVGEPGHDATFLELVARVQGNADLGARLRDLADVERPFQVTGRLRPFGRPCARFAGHTGRVLGMATLSWPGRDHPVLVTTSRDTTARVWDPHAPGTELARFDHHTDQVTDVAALSWPGRGHPVVITTSRDATARVWDPQDPETELARFDGHTSKVTGVATLSWPGRDHPLVITTSWDKTARVWDPLDPGTEVARFDGHTEVVMTVVSRRWPGQDHPIAITGSIDGTARAWDPREPNRELARFDGHTASVLGMTLLPWPGQDHPVVAVSCIDGTARVWNPDEPKLELARFDAQTVSASAIAAVHGPANRNTIVAIPCLDGAVHLWEPQPAHRALQHGDHHTDRVMLVNTLPWPGRDQPAIATTSLDGTARIWDPQDPHFELARFDRHTDGLGSIATLSWPGRKYPVAVTTSWDGTARVWDPQEPDIELARFNHHSDATTGIAALPWPGRDHQVIVTASYDGTARVWDPQEPDIELARFNHHDGKVVHVDALSWPNRDAPVVVTTSWDGTARVWDPLDPDTELARFDRHTNIVISATTLPWPGRDHPVIATTSFDTTARVWDPQEPSTELARFDHHTDGLFGMTTLPWPGRDHPVIATTSWDGTVRIWDPYDPDTELAHLPLLGHGGDVAALGQGRLVATTTRGFLVFDLFDEAKGNAERSPAAPRPVSLQRKVLAVERSRSRAQAAHPNHSEFALTDAQYEDAIAVIRSTLASMERTPSVASARSEMELRDQLLVQLNGTFRGTATGETFLQSGKTDILIAVDGRHVFVGECKWWTGSSDCRRAVDQLLSYLPWRDEKAALVLFINRKNATAAIKKADEAIQTHPTWKRAGKPSEDPSTRRNYILGHPDDADREIHLAVLFAVLPKDDPD